MNRRNFLTSLSALPLVGMVPFTIGTPKKSKKFNRPMWKIFTDEEVEKSWIRIPEIHSPSFKCHRAAYEFYSHVWRDAELLPLGIILREEDMEDALPWVKEEARKEMDRLDIFYVRYVFFNGALFDPCRPYVGHMALVQGTRRYTNEEWISGKHPTKYQDPSWNLYSYTHENDSTSVRRTY